MTAAGVWKWAPMVGRATLTMLESMVTMTRATAAPSTSHHRLSDMERRLPGVGRLPEGDPIA